MFRIGRNACSNYLRRAAQEPVTETAVEEVTVEASAEGDPAIEHERATMVRRALLALPVSRARCSR